jgi:acyl carrier protein
MINFFKRKNIVEKDDEIFFKVVDLIKELTPDLKDYLIKGGTTFQELGFDSIKYINLMLSLEDIIGLELEIIVENIELSSITTLNDLVVVINKYNMKH